MFNDLFKVIISCAWHKPLLAKDTQSANLWACFLTGIFIMFITYNQNTYAHPPQSLPTPSLNLYSLTGIWRHDRYQTNIRIENNKLIFCNEQNDCAEGNLSPEGTIEVPQWKVTGYISQNKKSISWSNQTQWTKDCDEHPSPAMNTSSVIYAPFSSNNHFISEFETNIFALLIMLGFIILSFLVMKGYLFPWIVATFITPFVGVGFLAILYGSMALYYLFFLPQFLISTSVVSAVVGLTLFSIRKFLNARRNRRSQ